MDIWIYCICVVEWTYGSILCVLVNGHIGCSACVVEWTYGGRLCVGEWK